jgi:ribosomal protein S18 acetylase RimI-like enzyme
MKLNIKNEKSVVIRPYNEYDFKDINRLNIDEGWTNLVEKNEDTKEAWSNSNVAFIVKTDDQVVGCIRGLTDGFISLYICELIIHKDYRGMSLGNELLKFVHSLYPKTRMELLANSTSRTFYEEQGFRTFSGFRKTYEEYKEKDEKNENKSTMESRR